MKTLFAPIIWALAASAVSRAEVTPQPQTIPELRRKVEEILLNNQVPALGIALMSREGPLWVDAIGEANVASHQPATVDTLFPLGSISKVFVGLSVLKLQEEGRVSLGDLLSIRAPEVQFNNPWEQSDPVRLVHLLEHTAGWSDNSEREARWTSAPGVQRREGLQVDPRSRTSRWQPGTCFSYSNLGPDIAAYVVEKITGERFEDYVAHTWFGPLGMADSSYCEVPDRTPNLAMGYLSNGEGIRPHFNVLLRPSGSVAASPRGMANLVAFFLGKGSVRGTHYLSPSAIDRMETPTSTYAAAEGVKTGYGLCNYTTEWNGWEFHGHGGVVQGAMANMAYVSEAGVGYAIMINRENGGALYQLEEVIRTYLLRDLRPPQRPPAVQMAADPTLVSTFTGWYEPITSRNEKDRYLERLFGTTRLSYGGENLLLQDLTNGTYEYSRAGRRLYERLDQSRSLVLTTDSAGNSIFQTVGGPTFRRMHRFEIALRFAYLLAASLLATSAIIWGFIRWLGVKRRRMSYNRDFGLHLDLLWASILGGFAVYLLWETSGNYFARAGGARWSEGWVVPLNYTVHGAFLFFAARGLYRALRLRKDAISRWSWLHSLGTATILAGAALYLVYGGMKFSWL